MVIKELICIFFGCKKKLVHCGNFEFKSQKNASKFVRYILGRLKGEVITRISRKQADLELHNHNKEDIRYLTREWRASGEGK